MTPLARPCARCGSATTSVRAGTGEVLTLDALPSDDGTVEIVETIGHPVAFVHEQPDLLGAIRHRLHAESCTGRHQAPYVAGSETSKAAADSLTFKRTETDRQRIVRFLAEHGPATDEAIADALNLAGNTQRPRRIELVERGDIVQAPERGKTRSGRAANRWMVTPAAERTG